MLIYCESSLGNASSQIFGALQLPISYDFIAFDGNIIYAGNIKSDGVGGINRIMDYEPGTYIFEDDTDIAEAHHMIDVSKGFNVVPTKKKFKIIEKKNTVCVEYFDSRVKYVLLIAQGLANGADSSTLQNFFNHYIGPKSYHYSVSRLDNGGLGFQINNKTMSLEAFTLFLIP